ncbi:death ligand signal enhancer isoform X1 [Corvus moneduloides]|uniref:death ligand signal enhancer isoform X1 n=1 Tax=Corvus moneduloides TaxID=1196302 RepID=UPI001362941B|nr:death ligand signal enhancer isoform X1 [Corvus moneduloides]
MFPIFHILQTTTPSGPRCPLSPGRAHTGPPAAGGALCALRGGGAAPAALYGAAAAPSALRGDRAAGSPLRGDGAAPRAPPARPRPPVAALVPVVPSVLAVPAAPGRRAPAVRGRPPVSMPPRAAGGAGGMWRLLLGRGRCAPTPARPACAPGLGGGRGHSPERAAACQDGPERGGRRQPLPGLVPRYSVREAVTWGAVGALLLQLLRQIAWLRSLPDARTERRLPRLSSLPTQPTVVTEASTGCPSEQLGSQFLQKASPEAVPENSSSGIPSGEGESQPWAEAGEFQIPVSSRVGPVLHSAKGDPAQRGHLEEAAFQLQQIFRIDISIALNILGIESMRAGHCRVAFTCFKLAADRGYSKAQFNVGLCYEHGRGTEKDLEKAGFYYCQAASSCHPMAQYRYARYLLQHGPGSHWDGHHKAVALLEQAAVAGVTEAQAYLGVFYMRGLQPQEKKGLKYLLLAANSGVVLDPQESSCLHFLQVTQASLFRKAVPQCGHSTLLNPHQHLEEQKGGSHVSQPGFCIPQFCFFPALRHCPLVFSCIVMAGAFFLKNLFILTSVPTAFVQGKIMNSYCLFCWLIVLVVVPFSVSSLSHFFRRLHSAGLVCLSV